VETPHSEDPVDEISDANEETQQSDEE